jgi:hypothetical protein
MNKITHFYVSQAKYIALDEQGNKIELDVDYWNSKFTVSEPNRELGAYGEKLLSRKHRINFVYNMQEDNG